jgi:hypothetical protein
MHILTCSKFLVRRVTFYNKFIVRSERNTQKSLGEMPWYLTSNQVVNIVTSPPPPPAPQPRLCLGLLHKIRLNFLEASHHYHISVSEVTNSMPQSRSWEVNSRSAGQEIRPRFMGNEHSLRGCIQKFPDCKWYSFLPLDAVLSLFCNSV